MAGGTARKKPARSSSARPPKKAAPHRPIHPAKHPVKKSAPSKKAVAAKTAPPPKKASPPKRTAGAAPSSAARAAPAPIRGDGRIHVLSLSFVRDGDEFLARLETDGGQITELKNRSLDQLLTLVAGELEDLLE